MVEQLRLVHTNLPISNLASGAFSLVLLWVLSPNAALAPLVVWAALIWLAIGLGLWLAVSFLRSTDQLAIATASAHATVAIYAVSGSLWGALSWLSLASAGPLGTTLIVCMAAGICAGGMAFMSPVLPVYVSFSAMFSLQLAACLLTLGGPVHIALGLGTVFFFLTTVSQASKASRAFRNMIELRFENEELVQRLREESERALTARAEAEEARVEAEDANLAKSKFLAAASHDLRQPVHAQGLFLDVLASTELVPRQREMLANARAACAASSDMLNTLLDFSRIEAGVINPQCQAFALQPLLNQIETELAPQTDAKGLVYRSRETQAVVFSDPALVALILRNLVTNAIRYTETGGVLVGCRQRAGSVVVEVWDTGIGIAPAHQKEVFREFHQLANPERDRRKGLGLGLAIADGLARALGHSLSLSSTPRRGSVFRLALPRSHQAVPARLPAPPTPAARRLGIRVLVIEDDQAVRDGMLQLLRNWGCACEAVESMDEAIASTRQHAPDLVISDYRLRELRTGLAAIEALRELLGHDLPALLITGDTAPERLREAMASGVPVLHKPVTAEQLYLALLNTMATRPVTPTEAGSCNI